jgi:hypothetical protein
MLFPDELFINHGIDHAYPSTSASSLPHASWFMAGPTGLNMHGWVHIAVRILH